MRYDQVSLEGTSKVGTMVVKASHHMLVMRNARGANKFVVSFETVD
jgi:hypothetical protein